ncbi:MAG: transglutaminase-like domain-containing protein [bacterium]
MKFKLTFLFLLLINFTSFGQIPDKFQYLIDQGEYTKVQQLMREELATNLQLSPTLKESITFEIERLERIKKDFTKTRQQVVEYIKQYFPDISEKDLEKWEKEKSLEYMIIDGEKRYFKRADKNLFRINKKAKQIKKKIENKKPKTPIRFDRTKEAEKIVKLSTKYREKFINPIQFKITYTLWVDPNAVPEGKVIRCWLPYPREIPQRQTNVQLLFSDPVRQIIANNDDYLQRTVYLEKIAEKNNKTKFQVVFQFTGYAVYTEINPDLIKPATINEALSPYIEERSPHIVFSPQLKAVSKKIVGIETNPYRIAQKLFKWVDDNIPWASAREYSTLKNISKYVYENRHADCGMKTIFFMTLCRMNGIPTKWQSGWRTEPGFEGMHDWGEIYFAPYGWLPVDVDNGLTKSSDNRAKWFFLGGMDSYRLIVNDDYAQHLYPAKVFPRSENNDFQRGEIEWEGGNLYFDKWDYKFDVEIIERN